MEAIWYSYLGFVVVTKHVQRASKGHKYKVCLQIHDNLATCPHIYSKYTVQFTVDNNTYKTVQEKLQDEGPS